MQTFKNPILPGFYPDPSVCRVGNDYYLVTSTFAYFPGVPIFHSTDLVNWAQIGNVLTRPSQLPLAGVRISRGIFAPTLRYHNGMFYMITTNVSDGGNFIVTATNPAGPWSEPYYLDAPGIDPSLFFDDDGKCYYHGTHDRREGAAYYGDNEIYLQELDLIEMKLVGERYAIWHSALKNAVWPEGPHIYKKDGYYYLLISEGGTGPDHAITVARSQKITDYFEGCKFNPILTHRHLGQKYSIVNVGHADLVETQHGDWWMVLLASRPYGGHYRNLGRETFLVPVTWENDWPVANYGIGLVREEEQLPNLPPSPATPATSFNFATMKIYPHNLLHIRNPIPNDYKLTPSGLNLRLNKNTITELDTVSYYGIRQQHMNFAVETYLHFTPENENEQAGLVIHQNHMYNYQLLVAKQGEETVVCVVKCENGEVETLAQSTQPPGGFCLKISAIGQDLSFHVNGNTILENANARILSTDVAGGFVGNTIGIYATSNGVDLGEKHAVFKSLEYKTTDIKEMVT